MSYDPTPEEVGRVANAVYWQSPEAADEHLAKAAIRAFVPEGTVPVFLTRENAEKRLRDAGYFPWGNGSWIHRDDEGTVFSESDALDAALNREQA